MITIEQEGEWLVVRAPYIARYNAEFKARIPSSGRRPVYYNDRFSHWLVAPTYLGVLRELSLKHIGREAVILGSIRATAPGEHSFDLDYMGLLRHRGGGMYTASGWVGGGWNVSFSSRVLQAFFGFTLAEDDAPQTLYAVLGIGHRADDGEIKSAFRRAARTWHPDVNREPGAAEQFMRVKEAYDILGNPALRRKYELGLLLESQVESRPKPEPEPGHTLDWRPPVRCGRLTIVGTRTGDLYQVERIVSWDDIIVQGKTMVSWWLPGGDMFQVAWRD
jgi:hypothetical protein